ncbi:MAG: DUF2177 family protein [Pseudomonadota bacterium]|nr:DUF2177 family protein [Pseudomonadota bacterium]
MKKFLLFLYTFFVVLFLDVIWLKYIAYEFFQHHLGPMLREDIIMLSGFAFYFVFSLGLFIFVVLPQLESDNMAITLAKGAFFGVVCYGSFDFTCYAIFKDFPFDVVLLDIAWGAFIGSVPAGLVVATSKQKL